jgi:enterochelin esterase-like enzyme
MFRERLIATIAGFVWSVFVLVLVLVTPAGAATPEAPLLSPDDARFGAEARAALAHAALLFDPADEDRVRDGVYSLPLPLPWPPSANDRRLWQLDVPGGTPLFLVTALTPAGQAFAPGATVTVDGVQFDATADYAVPGVPLSDGVEVRQYDVLANVLAPLPPGRHAVVVACNGCAQKDGSWPGTVNSGSRMYVLNVSASATAPAAPVAVAPDLPAALQGAPDAATASVVSLPLGALDASLELVENFTESVANAVAPATPSPSQVLDQTFYSDALGREMSYRVYLPQGYGAVTPGPLEFLMRLGQEQPRYPVLYLLHGLGATNRQWSRLGAFDEVERQVAAGAAPVIVVLPTGNTGYWVNQAGGGARYGDYVAQDLVAQIDATYRTVARPEARALGGISMGGNGALQISLNYPGVFGTVGAHSPALRTRQQAPYFMGGFFPGTGASPGAEAYAARDPLTLVKGGTGAAPGRLWVDVGQQDVWAPRVQELHAALQERGWAHTWLPATGGHDAAYWQRRLPEYIGYYLGALGAAGTASAPAVPATVASGA